MENEKELILNDLTSKIKEVTENTNYAYSENNLYVIEQMLNLYKETFPNFNWTYDEETGVLTAKPIVNIYPIDIIVKRKEDEDESCSGVLSRL